MNLGLRNTFALLGTLALVSGWAGGSGRHTTVTAGSLAAGTNAGTVATNTVKAPPVIYVSPP